MLSSRLSLGEFDWSQHTDSDRLLENRTVRSWVDEFKSHYLESHSLSEKTWKNDWEIIYDRLPQDSPVTADLLTAIVFRTERNSRNRLETCGKLQKLADFIKLKINILQYKGDSGASKVRDREIPSDADIVRCWYSIPKLN
ncbi:hypothetical protein [Leptolyngbya sp. NIES-2104]|uniref:hypothetical protein n=1 Tax=Leptolyngbya sp. NIES-2104 TaxID=1552121 RepID=UPI0006EC5700|nr:hypothetical protein [Leptolyngbya sp. NIES-2104]GAP95018.1 hypothetical protein NIES2104_15380 [Leptolyngbya sp. NIES-2104]